MFEDQTREVILQRMIMRNTRPVDTRQGSIFHDFTNDTALEFVPAYAELDNVLNWGFASTSFGQYLQERCAEVGIYKKPAVQAFGQLTFTGPVGLTIPKGQQVSTLDDVNPVIVETLNDITFVSDSTPIIVDAVAVQGGTQGNVPAGALSVVLGDLAEENITVINEAPFNGGENEETDDDLKHRYKIRTQNVVAPANSTHYRLLATEVPGVFDARVYPRWRGKGTVRVVCLSTSKRSPSAYVIQQVIDNITKSLHTDVDLTVDPAEEVAIDVDAKLTLMNTPEALEIARTQIAQNLTNYYANLAFNDLVVRYARIGDNILEAQPVIDYENLRINGLTSNIVVQDNQVPVLGRLSLTI